jgi:hypothetical protein
MSVPLVTFDGFLKQIDRRSLGPGAAMVLDKAFPRFWPADPKSDHFVDGVRRARDLDVDDVYVDLQPARRLAGCRGLPRGRYHSLCHDQSGDDGDTLVNELTAYMDPLQAGILLIFDMANPKAVAQFEEMSGLTYPPGPWLLFLVRGRPGAISPLLDALQERGLADRAMNQREDNVLFVIDVPYTVTRKQIDDAFDLRRVECQQFVVEEFFKRDTERLTKAHRGGIDRFAEALPILLHDELGGGPPESRHGSAQQAFAAFLRDEGASALVFPSARSDVLAEQRSGALSRWRGWNLVDYRNAEEPLVSGAIDGSPGWPSRFPKGVAIRESKDGEYAGSFEVRGLARWHRQRLSEREAEFLRSQQPG